MDCCSLKFLKNVRLSVMDKIQNYYAPKLKAYYATL